MKVALIQFNIKINCAQENVRRGIALAAEAARGGAALILMPEMWSAGLHPELPADPAVERTPEILADLARLASETGSVVAAGSLPERRADGVYNSAWLIGPSGVAPVPYRKIHLFRTGGEDRYTRPGRSLVLWETPLGPAAPFICFDLRFPELFRAAAFAGARLFLHPTQWPMARTPHLVALLRARAIENQAYVLSANACGHDGLLEMAGRSSVVDPWGETLLEAAPGAEGVFTVDLDPGKPVTLRERFPFLREAVFAGAVGAIARGGLEAVPALPEGAALRDGVLGDVPACEAILRALPSWFGIGSAIAEYAAALARLPFAVVVARDEVAGFAALARVSAAAFEVHVMACRPEWRGRGIGRALCAWCEARAREAGAAFLQVKTLAPARPDPSYAATRGFYERLGFHPLEEFPAGTLWPGNPCLVLVKPLSRF